MQLTPKDSFKSLRDAAIEEMKTDLAEVEPTGVPAWIITIMIVPVWLWEALKIGVHFILRAVAAFIPIPVVSLYYLIDTLIVMTWFFWHIVNKMSGGK